MRAKASANSSPAYFFEYEGSATSLDVEPSQMDQHLAAAWRVSGSSDVSRLWYAAIKLSRWNRSTQ